jgi:catechol 2,3-dioxygenase-like lactoylglutathione lyase family enzyme
MQANFIFYVGDQKRSSAFYQKVLGMKPELDVPGMTEFKLSQNCILGLMPEAGIKRLLGDKLPDPSSAAGIARAEIYFTVDQPEVYHQRALANGARELSPLSLRDWGDEVAYSLDPDGHVLCFASHR